MASAAGNTPLGEQPAATGNQQRGGGERGGYRGGRRGGGRGGAQAPHDGSQPHGNRGGRRGRGGPYRGGRGDSSSGGRGGPRHETASASLPSPAKPPPPDLNGGGSSGTPLTGAATEKKEGGEGEEEVEAEVCFICASNVVHQSVAPCNHRTCHICALRLRALYKTRACAHCRVSPFPFLSVVEAVES